MSPSAFHSIGVFASVSADKLSGFGCILKATRFRDHFGRTAFQAVDSEAFCRHTGSVSLKTEKWPAKRYAELSPASFAISTNMDCLEGLPAQLGGKGDSRCIELRVHFGQDEGAMDVKQ